VLSNNADAVWRTACVRAKGKRGKTMLKEKKGWLTQLTHLIEAIRPRSRWQWHSANGTAPTSVALESTIVPSTSPAALPRHGQVAVIGQRIFVTDPDDSGDFATLFVPDHPLLQVTRDGEPVHGRVAVHAGSRIHLTTSTSPGERRYRLTVTPDKLEVVATVEVTLGLRLRVRDCPPSTAAELVIDEELVPPSPDPEETLLTLLAERGFQGSVDHEAVSALVSADADEERVVLRGRPPQPGRPSRYQPISLDATYDPVLHRRCLATVPMGTTIAILQPGVPGVPGCDVFGRPIPADPPGRLPKLGDGVIEVGGRVIAVRSGQPVIDDDRIDVVPNLVFDRDVGADDGVIEFDGHVAIRGSVLDGSVIRAKGRVEVHGDVLAASVSGGEGVFVKGGIVGSNVVAGVVAGSTPSAAAEVAPLVEQLAELFTPFHREYLAVLERPTLSAQQSTLLAQVLLDRRHPELARTMAAVAEYRGRLVGEYPAVFCQLADLVAARWMGIARTRIAPSDVEALAVRLSDCRRHLQALLHEAHAPVSTTSIASSRIKSSGTIIVRGSGVYGSELTSGQAILIRGSVRGGTLEAVTAIRAREFGTPYGAECCIRVVAADGRIACRVRHPNVRFEIGAAMHHNLIAEYGVSYRGEQALAEAARLRPGG
jgi:hypothetical protein